MTMTSWFKKTLAAALLGLSLVGVSFADSGIAHAASYTSASTTSAQKADKVVAFAQSLIGKVHYRFGVNNPRTYSFDCSSFTKYVFASQGVDLKWGSRSQSRQGTYVPVSSLRKGDLLFFSVSKAGQVNHVGIYMGNGKFIHNTTGSVHGVTISNFSSYTKRFITARRVL